ncbi:MAG: SGNH/GDSL hydrolase family protein [Flavobacteriales bacterium]|nr:SGNH/GDSL hydrolase family protein [Flavobacteriales bacterium]
MGQKRKIPKLFKILLYLAFLFALQEVALRICFPIPEIENFNRINYQILAAKDNKSSYIRNIKMMWKSTLDTEEDFIYNLNPYGYRDRAWNVEKDNDQTRVMVVGDSFVEGMMAVGDETLPMGFANSADEAGLNVEAMNFGMMGIGLNEYIKLIVDAVPVFKPDYLIMVLFSNDIPFNRPYFPTTKLAPVFTDWSTPRLKALLNYSKNGDPIPFRWSFDIKRYYKAVPDKSNPWTTQSEARSKDVTPPIADAMMKGDFNFFRSNWILEEEKFLRSPTDVTEKLKLLREFTTYYGTEMLVCYIPSRNQVSEYYYKYEKEYCQVRCPDRLDLTQPAYQIHRQMLSNNCSSLDIPYYDLTPMIIAEENKENHLYWNYDDHMKGSSYLMMGDEIFKWWQKEIAQ